MIRAKIVATLGPASSSPDQLERLVTEGVDVFRFNLSHGEWETHERALEAVRSTAARQNKHIASMADLCGPKVRTASINPERATLETGGTCTIVRESIEGSGSRFSTNYPGLIDDLEVGHRVLIEDGMIRLLVTGKSDEQLTCSCITGGVVGTRKGINAPDSTLSLPTLTDKDRKDLVWAVKNRLDYVALSFVRRPEDLELARKDLTAAGGDIPLIAKIETPQAIDSLDGIIEASDAILVARGDLGVEMDVSKIPMLQKDIVSRCRAAGKPVIVATQMLHTMVDHPTPTRAEVSDVANAVLDGADAVMLSGETSVGKFPVEAVKVMRQIVAEALSYQHGLGRRRTDHLDGRVLVGQSSPRKTTAAVARSAAMVAHDLGAKLIAVWCHSGTTAKWISKYRCLQPIAGLSADPVACRRLALCYGIDPVLVDARQAAGDEPWAALETLLAKSFELSQGDMIVLVGDPEAPHRESTVGIHVVGAKEE